MTGQSLAEKRRSGSKAPESKYARKQRLRREGKRHHLADIVGVVEAHTPTPAEEGDWKLARVTGNFQSHFNYVYVHLVSNQMRVYVPAEVLAQCRGRIYGGTVVRVKLDPTHTRRVTAAEMELAPA
jgi:hypothetical protein